MNFELLRAIDQHPHFTHDNEIADFAFERALLVDAGFKLEVKPTCFIDQQAMNRVALSSMLTPDHFYYYGKTFRAGIVESALFYITPEYKTRIYKLTRYAMVRRCRDLNRDTPLDWRTVIIRESEILPAEEYQADLDWLIKWEYIKAGEQC